jgi:pilus assembly protein Flp/PilA
MALYEMIQWLQARVTNDERGATAVEYGMLVALIAAVVIGIVVTLGGQINTAFTTVSHSLTGHGGN